MCYKILFNEQKWRHEIERTKQQNECGKKSWRFSAISSLPPPSSRILWFVKRKFERVTTSQFFFGVDVRMSRGGVLRFRNARSVDKTNTFYSNSKWTMMMPERMGNSSMRMDLMKEKKMFTNLHVTFSMLSIVRRFSKHTSFVWVRREKESSERICSACKCLLN